jgi:photosystem II stability/assembly factor-like uncharacterized protein
MKALSILLFIVLNTQVVPAQKPNVEVLTSGTKTSLRGLSVVNDNVLWVSGSNGTVGKSSNAGKNWKWMTIKGFEKTDFRDIEAFDANTAIIMAVDAPAYILKTIDGGETWKTVYENKTKGMFLDAMDFLGPDFGMVVGDPINGKVFIATTTNGGDSWKEMPVDKRPLADSGEAFFAASGSNLRLFENDYFLASGGTSSHLFDNGSKIKLHIIQVKETTGANAIDVHEKLNGKKSDNMIVVGGDFNADSSREKNCFYTRNGGKTWKAPAEPPHGYRSCVEFVSKDDLIACGLNGVDYSFNGGRTWQWISKEGFHVCKIAKIGEAIFFAGGNGKVGRIVWR